MKCLVIFGPDNAHPLARFLNAKRRHVWCALQDVERNSWVSYNWHQGLPIIQVEAAADYDLATHYRAQGYSIVEIERGEDARLSLLMFNNCVAHVKSVCAIKSLAVTPQQLYTSLVGGKSMKFKQLFTAPGFGGSTPAPPPPPPPLPPPPNKADPAVVKSREDEQRRLRQQRGIAGTIKTRGGALSEASTADKTLLGN